MMSTPAYLCFLGCYTGSSHVRHRFRHLLASSTRPLRLVLWLEDLRAIVCFVKECFLFRSNLLVDVGAGPSHEPLVAEHI